MYSIASSPHYADRMAATVRDARLTAANEGRIAREAARRAEAPGRRPDVEARTQSSTRRVRTWFLMGHRARA